MEKPKFETYTRPNGHNEFEEFLPTIPAKDQQKLLSAIKIVEDKGLLVSSHLKITSKLRPNLFEIRSKVGNNIQRALYFHVVKNQYIITHGFTKKSQKTPESEITHAISLRTEFEESELNK